CSVAAIVFVSNCLCFVCGASSGKHYKSFSPAAKPARKACGSSGSNDVRSYMNKPAPLVAVTGSLPMGGSSTFLVNFARAMHRRGMVLPVVVLDAENAYADDFKTVENPVHCLT